MKRRAPKRKRARRVARRPAPPAPPPPEVTKRTAVLISLTGGIREIEMSGTPPMEINVPVMDPNSGAFVPIRFRRSLTTAGTGTNGERIYFRETGTFQAIRRRAIEDLIAALGPVLHRRGRRAMPLPREVIAILDSHLKAADVPDWTALGSIMSWPWPATPPSHPNCRSVTP